MRFSMDTTNSIHETQHFLPDEMNTLYPGWAPHSLGKHQEPFPKIRR